jgi:hypothetical protein
MHHAHADKGLAGIELIWRRAMREPFEVQLGRENLSYRLTFKDVVEILETIDRSPGEELHLEVGDLKLTIEKKR